MNNKIDYYLHKTYEPDYYQRRFEDDLPKETDYDKVKRAALIALPFVSLYRPIGSAISMGTGVARLSTNSYEVLQAKSLPEGAYRVMHVGLAALALAATWYQFTLGMLVTTGADLVSALTQMIDHLFNHQYEMAAEEFVQAVGAILYLGIMIYGSLELVIASILVQTLMNFYQVRKEWNNDRLPEAVAKMVMGCIRLYQADGKFRLLRRRNALIKKYEEFAKNIQKGREIDHLWDHPAIREGVVVTDARGREYNFGDSRFGLGKGLVKGMNVNFRQDGDKTVLEFKINHVHREILEDTIDDLKHGKKEDFNDLLKSFKSRASEIEINKKDLTIVKWYNGAEEYQIDLKGLGTIRICESSEVITLYDKVIVEMDKDVNLFDFHEALSLLNLDDALRSSAAEDIERMKIGHLFHTLAPREALDFERSEEFFDLSIDELKEEIVKRAPDMEWYFERWLPNIELRETLPGKMRFAFTGLADDIVSRGGLGLTAALMGAWTPNELKKRTASILKMGLISHEARATFGIDSDGLSAGFDYLSGGADSVFTQMITDEVDDYNDLNYYSPVRFLISPKVLETGTYQYHDDIAGSRQVSKGWGWWWLKSGYSHRPNILEFVDEEQGDFNADHEVMIKDRIPPEWITGILVENETLKQDFLKYFRKKDIIQLDDAGNEMILGKLADQFIHVGSKVDEAHFTRSA